ncbi:MAG: helix-turn-helix transcriptional regulator [Elusimicrobiota bacterium]
MPFCHICLTVQRINKTHQFQKLVPDSPITLGDHLLKRRLNLGISITEASRRIGTDRTTLGDWEANCHQPDPKFLPKIYQFLGYCLLPSSPPATLSKKLKLWRESQGLTQLELARLTKIDESSLARWERGQTRPYQKSLEKIQGFFGQVFGCPASLAI